MRVSSGLLATRSFVMGVGLTFAAGAAAFPSLTERRNASRGERVSPQAHDERAAFAEKAEADLTGWKMRLESMRVASGATAPARRRALLKAQRYLDLTARSIGEDLTQLKQTGDVTWRGLRGKIETEFKMMEDEIQFLAAE